MKKIIFLFLNTFIAVFLSAQNTNVEKVYYENSNALWYEYEYIVGKTAEIADIVSRDSETKELTGYDPGGHQLSDVIKHGYYKEYYEDGTLKRQLNYKEGKKSGKGVLYYPNGKMESEFTFSFNVLQGDFIRYHDNGEKMDVCQYKEGKRVGKGFLYYDDSRLYLELDYLPNEKLNYETDFSFANAVSYYSDGKLKQKGLCKIVYARSSAYETSNFNYLFDGKWESFDTNGNLISVEPYIDDLISGIVINYYPNGNKKEELECVIIETDGGKQSIVEGNYVYYHENGIVSTKGLLLPFEDDNNTFTPKRMFVWRWYDEQGEPLKYVNYNADKPQKEMTQPDINKEENLSLDLPFTELKKVVLSKYGGNYFFHFQESIIPYIYCKYYFGNCINRANFYKEVDGLLGMIYKQMEQCNSKACLEKGIAQSNLVFKSLKELSDLSDDSEFGIIETNLRRYDFIEDKIKVLNN